jgi:aminoglycoside phosphotransferase (APT) family kinase protein
MLDWEEAAWGDPGIDVAYARMNMLLMGLADAADAFLHTYEAESGRMVENLGFWELAAAVRPMFDPGDWRVDIAPRMILLQQFIQEVKTRI